MTKIDDGGPAFPHPPFADGFGMSLRDWFAGQALSGLLAGKHLSGGSQDHARMAFKQAGAMIEASKKGPSDE